MIFHPLLGDRLMVGLRPLEPAMMVRIHLPQLWVERLTGSRLIGDPPSRRGPRPLDPCMMVRTHPPQLGGERLTGSRLIGAPPSRRGHYPSCPSNSGVKR